MIDTPSNSPKNELQHNGKPQFPIPPIILALSLGPTCLNSIRHLNTLASFFNKSLKSTRSSDVYIKITLDASSVYSQLIKCISRSDSAMISLQISYDFCALILLILYTSMSALFATRLILFNSLSNLNSDKSVRSAMISPNSNPLTVSTTTLSPFLTSKSVEK